MRKEGKVKFFNTKKGFGFIAIDNSDEEVFVHTTNVTGRLRENDKVTFEVEDGEKGPSAVNVKRVKK
ncbi:cold-shock protein [Dokdonia donghaensis DSW-1]|uniref:Cold-shock protein n=1 Tax=Dokdonia donghaensis DSW-1 TaxID=1300343 RepID=A0A0A2H5M5_9FLAO|nr:cold-shock protein [Dokdonia donghaensis DSW-1]